MQQGEAPEGAEHAGRSPATPAAVSARRCTVALPCVGAAAGVLACLLAGIQGENAADAWATATRLTARVSAVFFLAAFAASPLARLWRGDVTAWLLRERRGLGLGFCAAHVVHLVAVIGGSITGETPGVVALVGGSIAYLWLAAMAITSTNAAVKRLGAIRWRRLHGWGMHYLWAIFTLGYLGRVVRQEVPLEHAVLFTLMVYVMLLRMYQRFHPAP